MKKMINGALVAGFVAASTLIGFGGSATAQTANGAACADGENTEYVYSCDRKTGKCVLVEIICS